MHRFILQFIIVSLALLAIPALAVCPWPEPGANRYTGHPAEAIAKLGYPADIAKVLTEAAEQRAYYRIVTVTRDSITDDEGRPYTDLEDMNFGDGQVCSGKVDRSMWPAWRTERALIYRERGHYLAVFTACGNFARITNPMDLPASYSGRDIPGHGFKPPKWWGYGPGNPVPEPGTLGLVVGALAAAFCASRRR